MSIYLCSMTEYTLMGGNSQNCYQFPLRMQQWVPWLVRDDSKKKKKKKKKKKLVLTVCPAQELSYLTPSPSYRTVTE